MRIILCVTLAALVAGVTGCASNRAGKNQAGTPEKGETADKPAFRTSGKDRPLIVTPSNVIAGRVMKVNKESRYVILAFPVGQMPGLQQRMDVYRGGLKAGEVRITGPQRDDKIVADLLAGDAAEGDEVRGQ